MAIYRFFPMEWQQYGGGNAWGAKVSAASSSILRMGCILTVMLLLAADLHAQTSTVIGTITYKNGRPAVNVFVLIGDRYGYTDVGGRYKIDGVPQGQQRMTVKSGRKILWQDDVTISGTVATVDQVLP